MSLIFNPLSSNFDYSPPPFSLAFKQLKKSEDLTDGGLFFASTGTLYLNCAEQKPYSYIHFQNISTSSIYLTGITEIDGVSVSAIQGISIASNSFLRGFFYAEHKLKTFAGDYKIATLFIPDGTIAYCGQNTSSLPSPYDPISADGIVVYCEQNTSGLPRPL